MASIFRRLLMPYIGRKFKEARSGLTLQDAANEAGVTRAQVNNIELGRYGGSVITLLRLCVVYQVEPSDVFPKLAELTNWVDVENTVGDVEDTP